ncbi:class I adenylate cyclase [Vibrio chagasii]|nr:class I adenylate cyclase [Vibrio chagasii]
MEECYDEYVQGLCGDGYLDCSQIGLISVAESHSCEEYFGSNLWQLYKSIDSPYKSSVKSDLAKLL